MLAMDDAERYVSRMSMSMPDKLDYLEEVSGDVSLIVDFGCASGDLIRTHYMKYANRAIIYIGYDTNPQMIELAKSRFAYSLTAQVSFTSDWSEVTQMLARVRGKKLLILNSVIHEVYSYSNYSDPEAVSDFWNRVSFSGFDYIAVRDMSYHKSLYNTLTKPSDIAKLTKFLGEDRVAEFEDVHGPIANMHGFAHLMLKYRYLDNWQRELNENYFASDVDTLVDQLTAGELYTLISYRHYRLPFISNHARQVLDIDFKTRTHVKIIMERNSHACSDY